MVFLCSFLIVYPIFASQADQPPFNKIDSDLPELLHHADSLFLSANYDKAGQDYRKALGLAGADIVYLYKKLALSEAALGNPQAAVGFIESYLTKEFNTSFLQGDGFSDIRNAPEFRKMVSTYAPRHNLWSFAYLYVALIGFYIAIMINFNRKIDSIARLLISAFIFIHSFFILHICLNLTNYHYEFPHSYLMSTSFSFIYGPLLYFYFKRITQQYTFRRSDLLHLLPTLLFLVYIIPVYMLPAGEKLKLMLYQGDAGLNSSDSNVIAYIVGLKLSSLVVYGYFIRALFLQSRLKNDFSSPNIRWQRNILAIHLGYIICYAIYGALISNQINFGFLYHAQVISMSLMVLYVGYSANVQPHLFSGLFSYDNQLFFKYRKSGLTESLSQEFKDRLIDLFDREKIYRESDLSLEILASRMDTTRHNISQVINEHFHLSFHELVNKYRIREAKSIFDRDTKKNIHIIEVAYEVGYNNKVTFNKAFKKDTLLTPTEYQKMYAPS